MERTKCLILILTFVGLLFSNLLMAQGIDDLGVVWTKTYGNGKIYNIKSNTDGTYTACGHTWNGSTPKGADRLDGLIIEYDETGNEIRRAVVRIPPLYIAGHTVTRATAYFNIAFKTDDGGFLAFGSLFNPDAPDGERQPNWGGGASSDSPYLTNGTWIVKLDANLNVVLNKLDRGMGPRDAWRTSDNNFVVGGFDANTGGISGTSDQITMLRKYKQDGGLVTDSRQNHREINAIYKFPTNNDFIAITPDRLLKIDANLNVTATLITSALASISKVTVPFGNSISPSIDNGIFINTHLNSNSDGVTNWNNGNGIFKIASNNSVAFFKIKKPSDTLFLAPMLLPGGDVPPRYVGVARVSDEGFANSKYYIYELTDNGKFTYRIGNEYPDGTELKAVSMSDGFFSCGQNAAGKAVIAKLSTCAKFIPNVGRTNENILPGQSFSGRTVSHVGNKGTVSYSWTLTDITPGGNAINGWAGITKTGTNNILPAQQFNLAPGKTHALLQYSVTALDSYPNNGVPQTCQQTYTILVKVQAMPDNITDADCVLDVVGAGWNINKSNIRVGAEVLHTYTAPVAGDLDGNKIPDIVALGFSAVDYDIYAKDIYIYFDRDRANPKIITTPLTYSRNVGGLAIARVKIGTDTTSLIVVHGTDQYLYAYNANGATNQTPVWKSSSVTGVKYTAIGFADFNNDGIPEVYAGRKIYNAVTGKELLASPGNCGLSNDPTLPDERYNLPAVADVYGDAKLEYIAGNQVYEVNIVNKNDNSLGLNNMTPVKTLTGASYTDGVTVVADFNRDGKLDVAVCVLNTPLSRLYIWDVEKEQLIAQTTFTNHTSYTSWNSVPFVGDIDGNGDLEMVVISRNALNIFDYNGTTTLATRSRIPVQEASGCTGITLFDFNQDGKAELIYRDEKNLYIYNVVGSTLVAQETIPCGSLTIFEYPIVLDVDADGSAEIVVIGGETGVKAGYLHILKSATPGTWGPARHVWNQYAYNVVNVNDDLTIPQYQLNPATFFPGLDGVPGINDIQPFNNFLQQQTTLDKNGVPVFLAPEAQLAGNPAFNYMAAADSMVITVYVTNTGNASLQNPFKVSVHKNQIVGDKVYTYEHKQQIGVGKTDTITFGISKFKAQWAPFNGIIIRINDDGDGTNDQPVCASNNVTYGTSSIIASDDHVLLFADKTNQVNVLDNDVLPLTCTNPVIQLLAVPAYTGTATANGSVIEYTPAAGETADMLRYSVHCGDASKADTATVYIKIVDMPDNIDDANCYITPNKFDWEIKQDYQSSTAVHHTYAIPLVGDVDGDGIPEIITVNASRQYLNILWGNKGKPASSIKVAHYINSELTTGGSISTYAMYKTKIAGVEKVVIAVIGGDKATTKGEYLHAYDLNGPADQSGTPIWAAPSVVTSVPLRESVGVADFDGDGIPEVYLSNRIYCGNTGKLLVSGGTTTNKGSGSNSFFTVAANVIGDAKLELIAGSEVYDVDISDKTGTLGTNKLTKVAWLKDVPKFANAASAKDGFSVIADINQDGKLDVIYVSSDKPLLEGINVKLIAWDVASGELLCQSESVSSAKGVGVPFIGNIDTIPDLEAVFMVRDKLLGYKPNFTDKKFVLKYQTIVVDESGSTGMTIFDFNNDKVGEIVYRDQDNLRIMKANPLTNKFENLKTYAGRSGTSFEFPVVADVDNDGASEIVVVSSTAYMSDIGSLRIYRSGSANSWAPARNVWNQYAYNVVNVNKDLSIPKVQLNPATVFPGEDGVLGTADDVRPYNNFLQQQTILNKNGVPIFLAPDAVIVNPAPSIVYHGDGDSIVVTLTVKNDGDAAFQNPFYLSAYADNIAVANIMAVDSIKSSVAVGDSVTTSITIRDVNSYMPFTNLVISLNDKGNGNYNQPECKYNNNNHIRPFSSLLMANRDVAHTLKNKEVSIAVLANDSLAACKTGVLAGFGIIPGSGVHNGTLTVNNSDSTFTYNPITGFVGTDSLMYYIKCGADSSAAKVYFNVYENPDNIVDPGACNVLLPKFDFKIKQQWETVNAGHSVTGTLVGDLDGDGLPEIIAYSPNLSAVNVYNGQTGVLIDSIKFAGGHFGGTDGWTPHMTSILLDADRNGLAEIIGVDTKTRKIHSYEADTTGGALKLKWKWTAARAFENPFLTDNLPHLNVADFNGDGVPELLIYNQIYNAVTGDYLGETEAIATAHKGCDPGRLTTWNQSSNFQTTADFDGDGYPEIVAGGKIYKVNFNAAKTAVTCSVLKSNATVPDGFTAVADIDMDGNLDVVVVSTSGNTVSLYVWSPLTTWSTSKVLCVSTVSPSYPAHSFPFIGDIDGAIDGVTGKKYPEICLVTARNTGETNISYVRAYKYDSATKAMVEKWKLGTSDASGGTGITLFDFNNDGINELVYRDETHLRILNGVADNAAPVLADPGAIFDCFSRTAFEYPVIADTDGDGSANICITCRQGNNTGSHNLRVYESGSQPWAPTRRVWNQVNYEPLQINENLTVPKMSIPKNMAFNGKHPYNGALIQVPIVDENFNPVIPAPDPATAGMKLEAINATTLRVWFDIQNKGTRFTNASLPITLYHTDTIAANKLGTKPVGVQIAPGDTVSIYWDITVGAYDKFMARIQDDGAKYPADGSYLDCNYSNNLDSINILLAINDTASYTNPGIIDIDVLANDFFGACERGTLTDFNIIPNSGLNNGSITINADSTFNYTFTTGNHGVDSLDYYIKCGADSSAARVYLLVNKPNALNYIACLPQTPNFLPPPPVRPTIVSLGFTSIPGVSYTWYPSKISTTPVTGGVNKDTLTVEVKTAADFGSWWVEPEWKGIKFERIEVTLSESTSCGDGLSDCAKDGTVLFREDFGGNDPGDPETKPAGISEVSAIYIYSPVSGALLLGSEYAIVKNARGGGGVFNDWWKVNDHKKTGETRNGYMLQINADKDPGQYYERQLTGLCSGTKLFFSAWIINVLKHNGPDKVNARFLIEHNDVVIAEYTTGAILESKLNDSTDVKWRMYGFDFRVPNGVDNLKLRIINDGIGSIGNDFVMDDIEIRICTPPINLNVGLDTAVCQGTKLDIISTYDEDCTFGDDLTYRWEFKAKKANSWANLKQENVTVNCAGVSPANRLTKTWTINPAEFTNEGYYRMLVSSQGNIDKLNCRASSDSVYVRVLGSGAMPDMRIQTCPDIGDINLSSYLDTINFQSVIWTTSALMPSVSISGIVNANSFNSPFTYKYNYKVQTIGNCFVAEGALYATAIKDKVIKLPPDTVVVCYENAEALQLNRILGIEAGSKIEAEEAIINTNYVKTTVSPAIYYGATIFDGKAVYENSALTGATYDYTGPLTTGIAKKVTFKYTSALGSCLAGKVYTFVIILTDELVP